jgi:CRISPR/Cas system-associated exonuclease Cas4 (RecB family)
MSGKVDLVIGRPSGDESRKVIVDLKTGRFSPRHRDDLRFYALVETLRTGVPPRKVASYYLDVGEPDVEDVTEGVLRTAVRRTLDGIDALIALTVEQRTPVKRPGTSCRWCALLDDCDEGTAHLHSADIDG